jgi:myosin-crossreactive antigen
LSFIPSIDDPNKTISDDTHAFNEEHIPHSNARLVRGGERRSTSRCWDFPTRTGST